MVKLELCVIGRVFIVGDVVFLLPLFLGVVVLAQGVANKVKVVLRTIHLCVMDEERQFGISLKQIHPSENSKTR